jgi:hypothetical protein
MAKRAIRVTCFVSYESAVDDPEDRAYTEESALLREIDLRPYVVAWEPAWSGPISEHAHAELEATADRKRINLKPLRSKA